MPNVQFVPTMEYMSRNQSSYLPDWTPSPDTTARRVAAILEPQNTYADLVHSFQNKQVEQQKLHSMEEKFRSMSMHNIQQMGVPGNSQEVFNAPRNTNQAYNSGASNSIPSATQQASMYPHSNNTYQHSFVSNIHDPTFLDRSLYNKQQTMNSLQNPIQQNMPLNDMNYDQNQLDQAWLQLSTELQLQNNMNPQHLY